MPSRFALPLLATCTLLLGATVVRAEAVGGEEARPRVGLALSGGGARGGAHVGVLQVLEEQRIPIDYVAGTSMGAIVGGLYASGMSVEEITGVLETFAWDGLFADKTSRRERSFRRKRDDDFYLVKSRPGIDADGVKFPAGVVQGQKIDLALARLTRHAGHVSDFDGYPIPFRAVATDIATGQAVVLGSGSLGRAIRASMSVPAVIAPVNVDGRKLVDGGVANNLPVDVVREMGADIVIAVDISTPLFTADELDSIIAITEQLTSILTRRNTRAQIDSLSDHDVLLVPDLGDITTASFGRAGEAVEKGREAALAAIDTLERLRLPEVEYAAWQAGLGVDRQSAPTLDFIRLDNSSRIRDSILQYRIVDSKVGEPLSISDAERDVGRIYGLELFRNVGYKVVEENGETGLEFYVREREWGPSYLQVGASYNSNTDGDNLFNVGISTLHTGLNSFGGELRLGLQVGEEPAGIADYHQPFGASGMWFWSATAAYAERVLTIFEQDRALADFELAEGVFEAALGREFGTWGEARAGIRYADGDAQVRIGDPLANPPLRYQRGEWFARFFVDELDSFYFPRTGYLASFEYVASRDGLGADSSFDQMLITGSAAASRGRHTFVGAFTHRSTVRGTAPVQSLFRAGGFLNLSGYNANELSGQHYSRAAALYYYRLGRSQFLPLYVGASVEAGNVWQDRADISLGNSLVAGSLFVGADTFIGPLYVAYGNAEGSADAFYIFLGSVF